MLKWSHTEVEAILDRAQAYCLDEVLLSYAEKTGLSGPELDEQVRELKRYLVLRVLTGETFPMAGPLDDLWHTWMLFSHSYVGFCQQVAGEYLHHQPVGRAASKHDDASLWEALARSYQEVFGEQAPEHLWPGLVRADVGSRDWWVRKLEKFSSGAKTRACLTVGCDGDTGPTITSCHNGDTADTADDRGTTDSDTGT